MGVIFLASCIVSAVFLTFFTGIGPTGHMVLGSDYLQCYEPTAESIIGGQGSIINKEYVRCAPGYSFLLVPIFLMSDTFDIERVWFIIFFNVILTAFSALLVYLIAKNIFGKNVAILSALLWLLYPFNQWLVKNPNSEIPFMALLLVAILFFMKVPEGAVQKRYAFLAGLMLGSAALVRPIGILMPLVLAVLLFFLANISKKGKIILSLLVIVGSIVFVLPWELYAFAKTGDLMPLSSGGPGTIREGFYFGARAGEGGDRFKSSEDVMEFMDRVYREPVRDNKSYGELFSLLKREVFSYPVAFAKIMIIKMGRAWYGTSQMWLENRIALVQLPYLTLGVFGIMTAFRHRREKLKQIIVILAVVMYFWLMVTATLSIMRYTIPAMSLIIIFSALAIDVLFKKYFKDIWKTR